MKENTIYTNDKTQINKKLEILKKNEEITNFDLSLFYPNIVDFSKEPMFFGSGKNILRDDKPIYKNEFTNKSDMMLSFYWRPKEIDYTTDKTDYESFTKQEAFIVDSNWKSQTMLDSGQGRSPFLTFVPFVTNPEIEKWFNIVTFFEGVIHADTYQTLFSNIVPNRSKTFDDIILDKEITKRAKDSFKYYDEFIMVGCELKLKYYKGQLISRAEFEYAKKMFYLALVSMNVLEGIRFFVSFACTFAFAENKMNPKMIGTATAIKLVARDEIQHVNGVQSMINKIRTQPHEGFMHIINTPEVEKEVLAIYEGATRQEMDWAKYLFKDGSILGLNENILVQYMKYIANTRLRAINYPLMYNKTSNPIKWIDKWLGETNKQKEAPMEKAISNYKHNSINFKFLKDEKKWDEIDV